MYLIDNNAVKNWHQNNAQKSDICALLSKNFVISLKSALAGKEMYI